MLAAANIDCESTYPLSVCQGFTHGCIVCSLQRKGVICPTQVHQDLPILVFSHFRGGAVLSDREISDRPAGCPEETHRLNCTLLVSLCEMAVTDVDQNGGCQHGILDTGKDR